MGDKLIEIKRYVLGFPRTLYINFRLLPFNQAIKLPIIVSHKTRFGSLKGKLVLEKIKPAVLKIGFGTTQTTDFKFDRTVIDLNGELIIQGKCRIGAGCKLSIEGKLKIGTNFNVTGRSNIICSKQITFDEGVLISWEVLVMDTDQHAMYELNNKNVRINEDKPIFIGKDVWICSRSTILKGASVPNDTVVAAGAVVSKKYDTRNTIIGGSPAKVIRENIAWK